MSTEIAINIHQLQELVTKVKETRHARTIRVADGVVAVVMPETARLARVKDARRAKQLLPGPAVPERTFTLESAFGSVLTPPHLRGKPIEEIIDEAKEDYAERIGHD